MGDKRNDLRMPFAEWLYRMSEASVPYQARALAVYAVTFSVTANEELACLVGMDTKGVADKTYNKWKRWLSENGWVIVKQVTIGRTTTIEVAPALRETPVTFTDVIRRMPTKFKASSSVPITDAPAVEVTIEPVKITDETSNNYGPDVETTPENQPLRARIEPPSGVNIPLENTKLARDLTTSARELAGLNGSADPMISDIVGWMHGGDEKAARNWLAAMVSQMSQDTVRRSYLKLKTDLAEGALIAKPLQTWTKIAQRMKAEPKAEDGHSRQQATSTTARFRKHFDEVTEAQNKAGRPRDEH